MEALRPQSLSDITKDLLLQKQAEIISQTGKKAENIKAVEVDIYAAEAKERKWFGDGICVNEQKPQRDGEAKAGKERTTTEMARLEQKDGKYQAIIAGEGIERAKL